MHETPGTTGCSPLQILYVGRRAVLREAATLHCVTGTEFEVPAKLVLVFYRHLGHAREGVTNGPGLAHARAGQHKDAPISNLG